MQSALANLVSVHELLEAEPAFDARFPRDGVRVNQPPQRAEFTDGSTTLSSTAVVEEHTNLTFRIALAVTRNHQDAEDATQEAFLQLLKTRNWEQIADLRAYIARIAWRVAVRKRKSQSASTVRELNMQEEAVVQGNNPEKQAIDRQFEARLHSLIDQLPEKLRQPLALSALGELSHVEIAKVLGLPEGTVRRRIHSARQKLRLQLTRIHSASSRGGHA
jgi:RNA polymerase sigma-70 factor (ECF subfamily)